MPETEPLSDEEAYERLHAAWLALGTADGATVRADTALAAGRRALMLLQMGLLKASDEGDDGNEAIKDRTGS